MAELSASVRVLLVDDDVLVRAGLVLLLAGADGIEIVGEVADGAHVADAVASTAPDVVLMDIRMPGTDGPAATAALRAARNAPAVVVLTMLETDEEVVRALRAGAIGYLLKSMPADAIAEAIRRAAAGEPVLAPAIVRRLIALVVDDADEVRRMTAHRALAALSPRELEVARALSAGKANREIAAELYMSVATVKAHVSSILEKLSLENRVQIALLARDAELP